MKKIILLIFVATLTSCGSAEEKKKGFEYNRTQSEKTKAVTSNNTTPIDLSNKGIGPISSLKFNESIDNELAAKGAATFKQKCTACHKPNKKLIGPAMKGIYERRAPEWVMNIMLNPTEMLKKDVTAMALLKEYNNIQMINQNLTKEEARSIAEYFRTL
ncbi:cytochrome c [Flavobacteriaceae bacterium]|jgi:cytochrome c551/c552|uniref:c-type cytochrome n=1 Tax=Candidatus Arcticimaribacter forsetii TaxID=2820661 RepID=UPI0020778A20|nr:cytochrome c [Candidatus Arcticimaribacter forsetii]MDA8699562.1 cytochrome c [Flavobacteriaceae bacterium]MDB2330001.1 cytochrome c [Flavobacteriaceae bacterium]MDB4620420.1 cytochrome c [Flavobacteriaceae bacterium]MDB4674116.1 cytochrome c [Flavobacteriaceae bacterium]MDB4715892.1 cytochrome c [Flavobacteriaceae bacterium]